MAVWANLTERLAAVVLSGIVYAVPGVTTYVFVHGMNAFIPLRIGFAVISVRMKLLICCMQYNFAFCGVNMYLAMSRHAMKP